MTTLENSTLPDRCYIGADYTNKIFDPVFNEFDSVVIRYTAFNAFFLGLMLSEVILLGCFFLKLMESLILAFSLGIVFFTFFSYFTLRIYFQTKKREQFQAVRMRYLNLCKKIMHYEEGFPEQFTSLANACSKFANRLHAREYTYYSPPSWLKVLAPAMECLSSYLHWEDVHLMKELMLDTAVKENLKFVKCMPTSLEAHAALANAYVMLSGLYIDPRKLEGCDEERWIPEGKYDAKFHEKFRFTAERAIEEFKILSEYAPDDPWVHSQLAYSYHDLQMPMEEIREYETIQKLIPSDKDNMYKLGTLYFQQGMNAKGLRMYEELKKTQYANADNLISHYGTFTLNSTLYIF